MSVAGHWAYLCTFAASCRSIHSRRATTGTRTHPPTLTLGISPLEISSYAFERDIPIASPTSHGLSINLSGAVIPIPFVLAVRKRSVIYCSGSNMNLSNNIHVTKLVLGGESRLRLEAEKRMGRRIPASTWEKLTKFDVVLQVLNGNKDIDWLTERAWDLLDHRGRVKAPDSVDSAAQAVTYQQTISQLIALEASKDPDVVTFRQDVLQGRLLQIGAVDDWIKKQQAADGPWAYYIRVPIPKGVELKDTNRGAVAHPPLVVDAEHPAATFELSIGDMLEYIIEGSKFVQRIPVAVGGVLDRLCRLSAQLAHATGWRPATASDFVLTGRVPLVPGIRGDVESAGRGHFTLHIDPMVPPQQVVLFYRKLRQKAFAGRRLRSLTPKHLGLALLLAKHPDESWEERRAIWNRTARPSERYAARTAMRFRRDVTDAARRLEAARISPSAVLRWVFDTEPTSTSHNKGDSRHGKTTRTR